MSEEDKKSSQPGNKTGNQGRKKSSNPKTGDSKGKGRLNESRRIGESKSDLDIIQKGAEIPTRPASKESNSTSEDSKSND